MRVVHPAFEGERVWVATGRESAKARHIDKNANVELFYQIGADMVHLTVTGRAKFVRPEFVEKVKLSEHWQHQAMTANRIEEGADIWS